MFQTEAEMALKLRQLYQEYDAVNQAVLDAQNRRRFLSTPSEIAAAETDETRLLGEMNRLMDRLRATEAHLARLRRGEKPRFQ